MKAWFLLGVPLLLVIAAAGLVCAQPPPSDATTAPEASPGAQGLTPPTVTAAEPPRTARPARSGPTPWEACST